MSSDPPFKNRAEFFKLLQDLHQKVNPGQEIKAPTLGHRELDLYQLYQSVTQRGGVKKIIENKQWANVVKELKLPTVRDIFFFRIVNFSTFWIFFLDFSFFFFPLLSFNFYPYFFGFLLLKIFQNEEEKKSIIFFLLFPVRHAQTLLSLFERTIFDISSFLNASTFTGSMLKRRTQKNFNDSFRSFIKSIGLRFQRRWHLQQTQLAKLVDLQFRNRSIPQTLQTAKILLSSLPLEEEGRTILFKPFSIHLPSFPKLREKKKTTMKKKMKKTMMMKN